jgi:tetratricopeptide (TPR) repeat protein
MRNPILWALDNEIDARSFERLCTDLLFRNGYMDIIPVGGSNDAGRDAEIREYRGNLPGGKAAALFFQYSLEAKWKPKLLKELKKIRKNRHEITALVFVTSRSVRGDQQDILRQHVMAEYSWDLIIRDREWLRLQLEEAHPDLAAKYFGVIDGTQGSTPITSKPEGKAQDADQMAWRLFKANEFEEAAIAFKEWLRSHGNDIRAWGALAWCSYQLVRYNQALDAVNHAVALAPEDESTLIIKASILTEDGIVRSSRAPLLIARGIFEKIALANPTWTNHYNYGNVLSALGDYAGAKEQYVKATSLDPNQPTVWKNLSSALGRLGDRDGEMKCLDRALALDPNKAEALVSKGICLVQDAATRTDGLQLLERAITVDASITLRWHHVWYWLSWGYHMSGKRITALQRAETGLAAAPHDVALLNVKAQVLSALWREDRSYVQTAITFFLFRHETFPDEHAAVLELGHIYEAAGEVEAAWALVDGFFALPHGMCASRLMRSVGCSLEDVLVSARFLPSYTSFRQKYFHSPSLETLRAGNLLLDDCFERGLHVVLSVPFGLMCQALVTIPRPKRDKRAVARLWSSLTELLGRLVPRASDLLVRSVRTDSVDALADSLSRIILAFRDIAIYEASWQIGYIAGARGISSAEVDKACPKGGQLNKWLANVTSDTLEELNRVLKFAPVG